MSKLKRILSMLLAVLLCLGILPTASLAADDADLEHFAQKNKFRSGTFTDVGRSDWFYDSVRTVYEMGLMVGKGESTFDPESGVTNAEVFTLAARLHAIYHTGSADFSASGVWYTVYADYLRKNGIADPALYDADAPATRREFASILAHALPDEALEEINKVSDDAIPDVLLSDRFGAEIYRLYRAGILVGSDDAGSFLPESGIKRSEVAAIAARMADPTQRRSIRLGREYTVTFHFNYNDLTTKQVVFDGETAARPAAPVYFGHVLDKWTLSPLGGAEFDFTAPILADTDVYAQWSTTAGFWDYINAALGGLGGESQEDSFCTVIFDPNGDNVENLPAPQIVKKGEYVSEPEAPYKINHDFGGWYLDADCLNRWDFSLPVSTSVTLFAKWIIRNYSKPTDEAHIKTGILQYEGTAYEGQYIDNQILMIIDENRATAESVEKCVAQYNGRIVGQVPRVGFYQIEFDKIYTADELMSFCSGIRKENDWVERASVNHVVEYRELSYNPNDEYPIDDSVSEDKKNELGEKPWEDIRTWHLRDTKIVDAWEMIYKEKSKSDLSIKVGVIDGAFDTNHPDLNVSIIESAKANITSKKPEVANHGTHVAGIIGAITDNGIGVSGVAINPELFGVQAASGWREENNKLIVSACDEATRIEQKCSLIEEGCKIINQSMGDKHYDYASKKEASDNFAEILYKYLRKSDSENHPYDFLIVQAAGNDGTNEEHDTRYVSIESCWDDSKQELKDRVIVVGNVQKGIGHPFFRSNSSSYKGGRVDIMAPGTDIYSTWCKGENSQHGYQFDMGTSMAAPIIAGVAALVWESNPLLSAPDVKNILIQTADIPVAEARDIPGSEIGYKMVNAQAAVAKALSYKGVKAYIKAHILDLETNTKIPGAKVTLFNSKISGIEQSFEVDAYGKIYEFFIPLLTYDKARVEADGYETQIVDASYSLLKNLYDLKEVRLPRLSEPEQPQFSVIHGQENILSMESVKMFNGAAHQTWTVSSSVDWTVEKSGDWFTLSVEAGKAGTSELVISMADGTDDRREGTVTFHVDGQSYTVKIYQQAVRIDGSVVVGGEPAPGAEVVISDGTYTKIVYTDENGNFYAYVPNGYYTVSVSVVGYAKVEYVVGEIDGSSPSVSIDPIVVEVEIRQLVASLTGTVVDGDPASSTYGQALEDVDVHLTMDNGDTAYSTTDADGVYRFDFYTEGSCSIAYSLSGYRTVVKENIVITKDTPSLGVVALMLDTQEAQKITVSGRIVYGGDESDENYGKNADGVFVEVFDLDGVCCGQMRTGTDGAFCLELPAVGTYGLRLTLDGYRFDGDLGFTASEGENDLGVFTAEPIVIEHEGVYGDLSWKIDKDGNLYINGSGAFGGFSYNEAPWAEYLNLVKNVIFSDGFISIDISAVGYRDYQSVRIPGTVSAIKPDYDRNMRFIVSESNAVYSSRDGVLFNKDQTILIRYSNPEKESYEIPNTVTVIETDAFAYSDVTEVTIPESVEKIGVRAFAYARDLRQIFIPKSVVSIETSALCGMDMLECIEVDTENPAYASLDGVLFTKDMKQLIKYPGYKNYMSETPNEYRIPDGVEKVADSAFDKSMRRDGGIEPWTDGNRYSGLQVLIFPDSVKEISWGNYAGEYAYIENLFFEGEMPFDIGFSSIGSSYYAPKSTIHFYAKNALLYRDENGNLSVRRNGWTSPTWKYSYYGYNKMKYAFSTVCEDAIAKNVTGTVTDADGNPLEGVSVIGYYGTYQDTQVTGEMTTGADGSYTLDFPVDAEYTFCYVKDGYNAVEKKVSVDASTTTLGTVVMQSGVGIASGSCGTIQWTVSAEGVMTVSGEGAFDSNAIVEDMIFVIKSLVNTVVLEEGITRMRRSISYYKFEPQKLILSKTVTILDEKFWSGYEECSIEVDAENPVFAAEDGVLFSKDKTVLIRYPIRREIQEYSIPNGVQTISAYAFYHAWLRNVVIPESVRTIGTEAFWNASTLKEVRIPAGVESIGKGAFSSCYSLASITVDDANQYYSIEDSVLYNKNKTVLVKYPEKKADLTFAVPDSVERIEDFSNNGFLTEISLGSKVRDDADYFYGFKNLIRFTVAEDNPYLTVYDDALYTKDGKTLIDYPGGKTDSSYLVREGVETIARYAFSENAFLEKIYLPASVTTLKNQAFSYRNELLTGVYFYGDAPVVMEWMGGNFPLYYIPGKSGWTTPKWTSSSRQVYNTAEWNP